MFVRSQSLTCQYHLSADFLESAFSLRIYLRCLQAGDTLDYLVYKHLQPHAYAHMCKIGTSMSRGIFVCHITKHDETDTLRLALSAVISQ